MSRTILKPATMLPLVRAVDMAPVRVRGARVPGRGRDGSGLRSADAPLTRGVR